MFATDAAAFLADFGESVTWPAGGSGGITGSMIIDRAGEEIDGGRIISTQYQATFELATWPGLRRGAVLTLAADGGAQYKLRTDPLPQADAVFAVVALSKV